MERWLKGVSTRSSLESSKMVCPENAASTSNSYDQEDEIQGNMAISSSKISKSKDSLKARKRRYDESYINLGFVDSNSSPLCILCSKLLPNSSMVPAKMRRHLETIHPDCKDKNKEFLYGRTFASLIRDYLEISTNLKEFIAAYDTIEGKKAYDDTLETLRKNFPQYIDELEGTADGAKVPFYKLFLLHMDDVTPKACAKEGNKEPTGCTTICVNQENEILGHTEDALSQVLNHFYIVSAHIVSDQPRGRWSVTEERFASLCYAGHLPGYTMNYNHHGLVFSINTLSAVNLEPGRTPRHFITRALLSAENFEQAQKILRDSGCGAADGCSVNMTFLQQEGDRLFHNAEMAPARENSESQLNILTASPGENIIHCNRYLRIRIADEPSFMLDSSDARLQILENFPEATTKEDVANMLGDQSHPVYKVFQETGPNDVVKTIAVGIFDCVAKTWALYSDNPKTSEPLVVIPMVFKAK